jgi:hypothetical protein
MFPDAFFTAVVPMLLGERSAAEVECELGACPSGTEALAFYAVLARRDLTSVLEQLFRATSVMARRVNAGIWDELAIGYVRSHRSTHWEPNRFAEAFPDFIARRLVEGLQMPKALAEVADFEYARFAITMGETDAALVRQYEWDVRELARDPCGPIPQPRTTVLAIYRDERGRGASCELGVVEMAALSSLRGRTIAVQVEPALMEAARSRLLALGVV